MTLYTQRGGSGKSESSYDNRQHGGSGPNRSYSSGGPNHPMNKLPEPDNIVYVVNGNPDPALMDGKADEIAEELANGGLKATQLRRYYDDVLTLRQRLNASALKPGAAREDAFKLLRADFKMLKAKAAYAHGRDPKMFPKRLLKFFIDHVHSVQTAADFDVFYQHFQAIVAFHKFYKPRD